MDRLDVKTRNIATSFPTRVLSFLFFVLILVVIVPRISQADIAIDTYCQLTIKAMQSQVSNFHELMSLVDQYGSDPVAFAQQETQKQQEFEEEQERLFESYGTSSNEYVAYMGKHGKEVEEYLADHPDIKQRVDELSAQVNSLLDQYEAKKARVKKSYEPVVKKEK